MAIELINKILSKVNEVATDSISVKVIAEAMTDALINIETPLFKIFTEWERHKIFPNFYDLQTYVTTSVEEDFKQKLYEKYLGWFQKTGSALDQLQHDKKIPNYQLFKIKELLSNLKTIFKEDFNDFFYPVLVQNIKATGIHNSSFEKLNQAWKTSLLDVVVLSKNIDKFYSKLPIEDTVLLEQKIENIGKLLAAISSSDTVKMAFLNALYTPPALPQIAKGDTLSFDIVLNDGTILTNTIFTRILLDEKLKKYFAEPSSVSSTPSSGKKGFSFNEVKDFSPMDVYGEGGVYSCYFEYKIPFTKDKGSATTGAESNSQLSFETVMGQSETKVDLYNFNFETTGELSGKLGGTGVSTSRTIGAGKEWGTEKTTSFELALGRSYGKSSSKSETKELGENSGYLLIRMSLITSDQNAETLTVTLAPDVEWIKSPNLKGFSVLDPKPVIKIMRWLN